MRRVKVYVAAVGRQPNKSGIPAVWLLNSEKPRPTLVGMAQSPPLTQQCSSCTERAIFATPYGRLCLDHTLEEMNADGELWMPQMLDYNHGPRPAHDDR